MEKSYIRIVASSRVSTMDSGPVISTCGCFTISHVAGAKAASSKTIVDLYRENKLPVAMAIKLGGKAIRMKDHLEALNHGASIDDLIACGVDLRRLDAARAKVAVQAETIRRNAPKPVMMVRRSNGETQVVARVTVQSVVQTGQKAEVAAALALAARVEKARETAEYARKHGIVITLSADEQAEMIKRNANKGCGEYLYLPERS